MKNKKSLFAICCSVIFAVVSIMAIWLYKAGAFNEAPVIAERPNNTYENTLRVATFEDNQPFSYYGENMEKTGYNVELSNDLANRLGMNLSLRFMTSEQAKEALLEGDIDIIMNSPEEDLDDERILISVPTYKENIVAFGKSYASNSAQLNGRKIAMVDNTDVREALESYNIENLHENLSVYSDPRDAMIALINDECDYAVMRYSIGCNILNQIGDKTVKGYFSLAYSLMRIGARDDNAELLERIDAAITAKKDSGSLDALRDKWTSVFFGNFSTNEFIRENIAVLVIVLLVLFLVVIILITYSYHTAIHDSVLRENEKELMVAKLSEDYDAIFMFNPEIEEYLGKQGSTKRDDNIYAVFGNFERKLQQESIINGLTGDYEAVFYIEPDLDKINIIRQSEDSILYEEFSDGSSPTFKVFLEKVLPDIHPEDRELFSSLFEKGTMREQFGQNSVHFATFRRAVGNAIGYYEVKFTRLGKADDARFDILAGIRDISEIEIEKIALETVQKYEAGHFDAILMDIQMDVMDGIQATKCIRALPEMRGKSNRNK